MTDNRVVTSEATLSIKEYEDGSWRVSPGYNPMPSEFDESEDGYPDSYIFMSKMIEDVVLPTLRGMAGEGDPSLDVKGTDTVN